MRAALRSRARTFARALDLPDEWLSDPLDLIFATIPIEGEDIGIRPAQDHTEQRRDPLDMVQLARATTTWALDRRFATPLDPPEYRPA